MSTPLADRLRPQTIDDMVGQRHLLGENMPLRNIVESGYLPNLIFYGPSGTGKTTLARIIAKNTNRKLHHINGTNASTADIKAIVSELDTFAAPNGILLYLDEIQYFNKKQQQSLLEYIESGKITLIASTTENPYFYIYSAVLSRCTVFEFKSVTPEDVVPNIKRGFAFLEEETGVKLEIEDGVCEHIATACGGDVRKSLNFVELCVLSASIIDGKRVITLENTGALTMKNTFRYDKFGDEHYDILSAYQKSMRGSDPDAALHYLARLLEAGDMVSA
ncbi:MAG: AAA family ATPase, partial [Clostridia bacterium]|nr:AAA family ATPase [Clostridia bacterium]